MKIDTLGMYKDSSGKLYEVIVRILQSKISPVSSGRVTNVDGVKDYKTACGIELNEGKGGSFVTLSGTVLTPA